MANLGVAFYKGAGGLEKSVKKAIKWFKRAGTADGMFKVATLLLEGSSGGKSSTSSGGAAAAATQKEAMAWLAKAAVAGHAQARVQLRDAQQQQTRQEL
jgi:TPR repeat protein